MKNTLNYLFIFIVALILTSCSSVKIDDYVNEKPTLKLEEYFNGHVVGHGFFQNRSGKIVKRFKVDIVSKWQDNKGVLDETFYYSDNTTSKRVWTIEKKDADTYIGTASDVIGEATGKIAGNALRWNYYLNLDVDGTTYKVYFDDWMYLMSDKIMLNKSAMSKFGFYLGEVVLTFEKK